MGLNIVTSKIETFFSSPRNTLTLGCVLGGLCTVLLLIVSPVYYRDSVVYMAMVNGFKVGDWAHAFDLTMVPLLPTLAGILARVGVPVQDATMLVSSIFCILTIFPLYGLFSFVMERKYAAWGALLVLLMPKIIRYGMAPLLDSGRWLFFSLALYLIFSFVLRKRSYWTLIWLGCAFAGLSLVRSEGAVYSFILLGILALLMWHQAKWRISFKLLGRFVLYSSIAATVCVVICLPRLIHLQRETGYPALDTRQTWAVRGVIHQIEKIVGKEEPAQISPVATQASVTTYGSINDFDYSWFFDSEYQARYWKNMLNGCYPIYLIFSIIGLIVICRRKEWTILHTTMALLFVANAIAFFLMRSAAGRYFFINTIFLMPFTMLGIRFTWEKLERIPVRFFVKPLVLLTIITVVTMQLWNGLDNLWPSKNDYFRVLGKELEQWQTQVAPRSGTKHITLLTIGDEYGWGMYSNTNSFTYSGNRIHKTWTIAEIATNGLSNRLTNYVAEDLTGYDILLPDVIVVANVHKTDPKLLFEIQQLPGVQEFSFQNSPLAEKVLFYRLDGVKSTQ